MKRGRALLVSIAFLVLLGSSALGNGLNLNSLGTRALTMGGAFVGLADDFSAIYWNPAGIAQFKTRYFGFYGTDIIPLGSYEMQTIVPGIGPLTVVNAKTVTKHYLAGLVAYYIPVSENFVAGFGMYVPAGLGSEWDGEDFAAIANDNASLDWRSKIGLITFSPALSYKISEQVSVGMALNINYGLFDIAMHAGSADIPLPPNELDLGQYEESMKGWGYGATFGILVKPSEKFSLGATFKTPCTVKFSGEASISNLNLLSQSTTSDCDREVTWPMWIAGGVAFRPMDNLILTADLQWTQWSKIDVLETDYNDIFWQIMMALSGDDEMSMHWDDALQIRFGAEYSVNTMAFRAGFYRDPSPTPDRTMNVLLPNYDFNVLTLGFGYSLDGLQIDFGLEYLIGKERNVPLTKVLLDPRWEAAMPGIYNMKIIVPNLSISYKF